MAFDDAVFNDAGSDDDDERLAEAVSVISSGMTEVEISENLVAPLKKIEKQQINYARTAKRVDVKRLKENLWKCLVASDDVEESTDKLWSERRFSIILQHLRPFYSESQFKDISIAFCFICLLHLANEKHLKITGRPDMRDLLISQD